MDRFSDRRWNLLVLSLGICYEDDRQVQREVCIGKQRDGGKSTNSVLVCGSKIF